MKTLIFNGEEFEAEKIIKTETSIIGKDNQNNVKFEFRGVSDFTMFTLEEGQTFYVPEQTIEEKLKSTQQELEETQNRLIETRASMENVNADFQNFMQYALYKLQN